MHINTRLTKQDYINAYKEMCGFFLNNPVLFGVIAALSLAVSFIPYSLFPLKMVGFAVLISLSVCLVTCQYLNGSLREIGAELKLQQRIYLPACILILCLSWLGFVVADAIMIMVHDSAVIQPSGIQLPAADMINSTSVLVVVVLAALVGIAQVLPLVLAHFCNGLKIPKRQGEHIWMALISRAKTFLAFLPIAQVAAAGVIFEVDTVALLIALSALYSVFLMFIVFNLEPNVQQHSHSMDVAEQGC